MAGGYHSLPERISKRVLMELNKIYQADSLQPWPVEKSSLHCIITSPPYWALRNYGIAGQLGMEKTPEEYVANMVQVFRHAREALRDDGTLWLNLGDTYIGGKGANGASAAYSRHTDYINKKALVNTAPGEFRPNDRPHPFLKPKDLVGIPWRVALALQADGWYLRQDIVWNKSNAMPEPVTDRCNKSHEYIFLLSKCRKYYFDWKAIREPAVSDHGSGNGFQRDARLSFKNPDGTNRGNAEPWKGVGGMRNKRSVWTHGVAHGQETNNAVFPAGLIRDCIKAGCPAGGTVGDPFMGRGTTALAARAEDRNYIGLELNPADIKKAETRLKNKLGLFI